MRLCFVHFRKTILIALLICSPLLAYADPGEETLQKERVATLTDESSDVKNAREALAATLAAITPQGMKSPRSITTSDGRQVLYGDLFENHQICALVELPFQDEEIGIGVGFALWNGKSWEPRNLFKIAPIWRAKGLKKEGDEYLPITPATAPFWMMKVTPDKPPLAVMVGMIWKYWQEHYLARYDAASRKLVLISEDKRPTPVKGYMRLYGDSGHRSVFQSWTFCKWSGEKLVPKGYWYDGLDRTEEFSENYAASYDDQGNETARYLITQEGSDKPSELVYSISIGDHEKYATVHVQLTKHGDDSELGATVDAYLFEKLTGLPRDLYPEEEADRKKLEPLENMATIVVDGRKDAVKMLSPKKKR